MSNSSRLSIYTEMVGLFIKSQFLLMDVKVDHSVISVVMFNEVQLFPRKFFPRVVLRA